MCALAMQPVMEDLAPKFERATGHKLAITFATLGAAVNASKMVKPRCRRHSAAGHRWIREEGKAVSGSVSVVALSGIGVVIRKGAPKPDVSSPEALKRTLLAAKSIAYTNPTLGGTSGSHVANVLDRLGIASEMKPKTVFPKSPVARRSGLWLRAARPRSACSRSGAHPGSGYRDRRPLPGDLQNTVVFAVAIMAGARDARASKALSTSCARRKRRR